MPDKLTGMQVFVDVVKSGSFIAAARVRGLSPQMVARHITALEQQLGVTLLSRTTRKQSLTAAGADYFRRCEIILGAVEDAERQVKFDVTQPAGTLRINSPVTFGRYSLIPFIADFMRRYPQIRIELTLSDTVISPLDNGMDAVIRIGEPDPLLRLVAKPLTPYRLILAAAPSYLDHYGSPLTPAQLPQHRCLGFSPWLAGETQEWTLTDGRQTWHTDVSPPLVINDWGALAEAATEGQGILAGHRQALAAYFRRQQLRPVLPGYHFPDQKMHLLYPARRSTEARLRLLVTELSQWFPPADRA